VAPRHIGVEPGKEGNQEMYDVFYAWDTDTIFNSLKDGVADRPPARARSRGTPGPARMSGGVTSPATPTSRDRNRRSEGALQQGADHVPAPLGKKKSLAEGRQPAAATHGRPLDAACAAGGCFRLRTRSCKGLARPNTHAAQRLRRRRGSDPRPRRAPFGAARPDLEADEREAASWPGARAPGGSELRPRAATPAPGGRVTAA
jgi:hypothetical protein